MSEAIPDRDLGASTRIWRLQYGPCWCHSTPGDSGSFDYVRTYRTQADLGDFRQNIVLVSERVIDGAGPTFRQFLASVPDPTLVVSTATCPSSARFWNELPNSWTPVEELVPVELRVRDCINGRPESLAAVLLRHVLTVQSTPGFERGRTHSEESMTVAPSA